MNIKKALLRKIRGTVNDSPYQLEEQMELLARELAAVMTIQDFRFERSDSQFEERMKLARTAALAHDAAVYVREVVIEERDSKVVAVSLVRDAEATQSRIIRALQSSKTAKRGFVYVAWSQRPETFFYVGKARNAGRLNLSSHGKLTHAVVGLDRATQLLILFPADDCEESLTDLESSMIMIAEWRTGAPPKYNKRLGLVPSGPALECLEEIGELLSDRGQKLAS
jgi:hypothetical protein